MKQRKVLVGIAIAIFIILLLWGNGFSAFPIILNEPCLKNMDLAEL